MSKEHLVARAQHEVAVPDGDLAADEDRDCRVAVGRVGVRVAHDDAAEVQLARPVELPLDAARPLDVGRALLPHGVIYPAHNSRVYRVTAFG